MLYIFLMMLVGYREPDSLLRYQAAIEAATSDPEEQRLLGTIARTENYFHGASRTPPFGLTWESYQRQLRCRALRQEQRQADLREALALRQGSPVPPRPASLDRDCEPSFTIDTGAHYALRSIQALRRTCAREVPNQPDTIEGRWLLALGRYHHGTVGSHYGCWGDPLAQRQVIWMTTVPPLVLPRHTVRYRASR